MSGKFLSRIWRRSLKGEVARTTLLEQIHDNEIAGYAGDQEAEDSHGPCDSAERLVADIPVAAQFKAPDFASFLTSEEEPKPEEKEAYKNACNKNVADCA